jgi:hypothetical protein
MHGQTLMPRKRTAPFPRVFPNGPIAAFTPGGGAIVASKFSHD